MQGQVFLLFWQRMINTADSAPDTIENKYASCRLTADGANKKRGEKT